MRKSVPKMSLMITSAIRHLREAHGSTPKEIMNYITSRYDTVEPDYQRQMLAALQRCLEYGIVNKTRGRYKLNTLAECIARTGVGPMEKPEKRKRAKKPGNTVNKGKGRGVRRRQNERARSTSGGSVATCGESCRCTTARVRNSYALGSDIPGEGSQEREEEKKEEEHERRRHDDSEKDVVCCFENKWRERCESGSDSTDRSRSTLNSYLEPNNEDDGDNNGDNNENNNHNKDNT